MKRALSLVALAAAGCAGTPEQGGERIADRCSVEDCFRPRDIRRLEVLDEENVIVYTGPQECPFRVEVRGFNCRLEFAMDINFVQRDPGTTLRDEDFSQPQRVCSFTPRVSVFTGIYDQSRDEVLSSVDPPEDACRVMNVESITDDQLIELFVDRRLAPPPPPIGNGTMQTPAQNDTAESDSNEEGADGDRDANTSGGSEEPPEEGTEGA